MIFDALLEFLHWKGYTTNSSTNTAHYKHEKSHEMPYKDKCFHSYVDNDLSNYRQFAALTTLPRKTRSTPKESFNRLPKDKGELKCTWPIINRCTYYIIE